MGGVALTGSDESCPAKAWPASFTVAGLRRCLIIFAPRTLILDRRTCTCRTPSLQWIWQRSKNFTSGAPISFTPNGPIGYDRWVQATGTRGAGKNPARRRGNTTRSNVGPAGTPTRLPRVGPKASTTPMPHSVDALTFHGWAFSRREDALSTLSFPGCH